MVLLRICFKAARSSWSTTSWSDPISGVLSNVLLDRRRFRIASTCTAKTRAHGETEQRLYALSAWEETQFFSDRERAALSWAEAITLISDQHASDQIYERVRQQFFGEELVNLSMAIIAINGWNRLSIAFRSIPGENQPKSV